MPFLVTTYKTVKTCYLILLTKLIFLPNWVVLNIADATLYIAIFFVDKFYDQQLHVLSTCQVDVDVSASSNYYCHMNYSFLKGFAQVDEIETDFIAILYFFASIT